MFTLNTFSLILAVGASFGLFRIALTSRSSQRTVWLLAGLISLLGALIGARIGYVLEHLHYFSAYPGQIASIWLGGLTWEGALTGSLLSLLIIRKFWQWSFFTLLDKLSMLLLPIGVAGWLACWQAGVAYGETLPVAAWWGIETLDESGLLALRTPVQPLAAISLVVFLGFVELATNQSKLTGWKGSLNCLVFSADMLLFSFLRADPVQTCGGLRFETWAAMVYTLSGIAALLWILHQNGKINLKINIHINFDFVKRILARIRKPHEIEPGTRTN
jgi:phosphatidylglycerol:prolipoprotein diacylglycerol transferase